MLGKFYHCAREVAARHPKGAGYALAVVYVTSDSLILTTPAVESGFFNNLLAGQANWQALVETYMERPLPFVISLSLVTGSAVMAKSFSKGHAIQLTGVSLLVADLAQHNQILTACSFLPGVAACCAGAFYKPLEKHFSEARNMLIRETLGMPKRLAGALFAPCNVLALTTACLSHPPNLVLITAAVGWLVGNGVSALLPKDSSTAPAP